MCDRWASFENFWADMGPTYVSGLTLDREDNSGNYEPTNCRWVPHKTNSRNKRTNALIETPVGPMQLCEAAEKSGLGKTTLCYRAKAGWPAGRMFDPPDFHNRV